MVRSVRPGPTEYRTDSPRERASDHRNGEQRLRTVHLVLVAAIAASCWGAPPATLRPPRTPSPAPTATAAPTRPSFVRVTPTPASASILNPTPSASSGPTPIAGPTFTADDQQIDALIRLGVGEMLLILAPASSPDPNMGDIFRSARDFASRTRSSLAAFEASPCTERGLQLFEKSMRLLEDVSQAFLDWVAGGRVDQFDGSNIRTAGERARAALESLDASC